VQYSAYVIRVNDVVCFNNVIENVMGMWLGLSM